ncbi:hypothetical protein AAFF_G00050020 [Aldrovandia affinis]|uniref:Uncharacterized protein n=1 Tax=Aldrovandia affinis TaxID=143900 RepID=A0AAD7WEM5_9TELE|nr:hypothetical protein AAFF_G00050020 [Aldrovandia affinis]
MHWLVSRSVRGAARADWSSGRFRRCLTLIEGRVEREDCKTSRRRERKREEKGIHRISKFLFSNKPHYRGEPYFWQDLGGASGSV